MKAAIPSQLFRKLPSVDDLMRLPSIAELAASYGYPSAVDAARSVLSGLRQEIASGLLNEERLTLALSGLPEAVENQLRR